MTHDTPGETDDSRLWCSRCQISVAPETDDGDPKCPSCGGEL